MTGVKMRNGLCSCPHQCLFVYFFLLLLLCITKSHLRRFWNNNKGNVSHNSVGLWTLCVVMADSADRSKKCDLLVYVSSFVILVS